MREKQNSYGVLSKALIAFLCLLILFNSAFFAVSAEGTDVNKASAQGSLDENLLGTDKYKYGIDIIVSQFVGSEKNDGYTEDPQWVNSFLDYLISINWTVVVFRDGVLPEIWFDAANEREMLILDKNSDEEWEKSQAELWKPETIILDKANEMKKANPDCIIIPVIYYYDGIFTESPSFSDMSATRLKSVFSPVSFETDSDSNAKEDVGFIQGIIDYFKEMLYKTFVKDNRYELFLEGIRNTIFIALMATLFGVLIGMIVAVIKVWNNQNILAKKKNPLLKVLNTICEAYTSVIRGTPVVVQLLITYNVIFVYSDNAVAVGIFAFSINSGAYISEIIRAGINSVDKGQTEAGRSLGLSQFTTMKSIVLPQALKNILPALGNEFIALLKETSVIGYLGVIDLTRAGEIVRSRTADAFFTLIFVAIIYFILVFGLSAIFKKIERRLNKSDKN